MPSKALKFCCHPGCPELTSTRFCPEHQKEYEAKWQEKKAEYNKTRESSYDRGYDGDWRRARIAYLKKHPLCEMCLLQDETVPAVMVHHKVAIKDGGKRLDPSNFMALCNECHEQIEGKGRFKRKG
jgi:5-methylcytosine-specific restriction protein A